MNRSFYRSAITAVVASAFLALAPGHASASPWWVDEFDGPSLSPEWTVQFENTTDAGWQRNFTDSRLETTGLVHSGGKWITVRMTRQVDPVVDFSGRFVHSWNADHVGEKPFVALWLLSETHLIAEIALADTDINGWGRLRVSGSYVSEIDATQSGDADWTFHRTGELLEVFLNGALLHTENLSPETKLDEVVLLIQGKNDWEWTGSHSIDHISIVPEPASIALAGAGVLMLLHRRRSA